MTAGRISLARVAPDSRYPLFDAYLNDFGRVAHLYDYSPHDPASLRSRAAELGGFDGDRAALAAHLEEYNRRLGAPPESLSAARCLAEPGAVVVIGGQQPGVLTGPLYTFWKAVAVLQLAEAARVVLGGSVPVIPVFWIGAEDHDLAEVAQVTLLTPDGDLARHVYDPGRGLPDASGYPARTSVGYLPAGKAATALLDLLAPDLWPTEFAGEILGLLRRTAEESANLADWFGRLLLVLFGRRGLVLVNPLEPAVRALQSPILGRMVVDNAAISERLAAGQDQVRRLGFEPQVEKDQASANLYLYRGMERVPLRRADPTPAFAAGAGDATEVWSSGELLRLAVEEPHRLSTGVVLRPLAQDAVFPVLAYVGGPGETSYFGLYRGVYHLFGRKLPVVYPRPSVTILEPSLARHLDKLGLAPEQALDLGRLLQVKTAYIEETDPVGIDRVFGRVTATVREAYRDVAAAVGRVDPALTSLAEKNLARVTGEIDWLRRKTWQEHRRNCRETVRRFDAVELALRPRGDFQERVFNVFPYLVKYGLHLADSLASQRIVPRDASVDPSHRFVWL